MHDDAVTKLESVLEYLDSQDLKIIAAHVSMALETLKATPSSIDETEKFDLDTRREG